MKLLQTHGNIAGIYAEGLPAVWRRGDTDNQVGVLQQNVNALVSKGGSVTLLVVDGMFGSKTEQRLKQLQRMYRLKVDGIYGKEVRNFLMREVGQSSCGFVRMPTCGKGFRNWNDRALEHFDYSWLTDAAMETIIAVAARFYEKTGRELYLNDGSLINGGHNDDHATHHNGKDLDILTFNLTEDERKEVLQLLIGSPNIERILYTKTYDLSTSVVKLDRAHSNHMHLDFKK